MSFCYGQKNKIGGRNYDKHSVKSRGAERQQHTHGFANGEHEKFYFEKLEKARYQDCYHKALIYILGISEDTRNHFSQIYDIKSGYIKAAILAVIQRVSWYVQNNEKEFTERVREASDHQQEQTVKECKCA